MVVLKLIVFNKKIIFLKIYSGYPKSSKAYSLFLDGFWVLKKY